jgi:hypothetical protein
VDVDSNEVVTSLGDDGKGELWISGGDGCMLM